MSMKLMYITNNPEIAQVVEAASVDRIFVDLEYIGKDLRQGGKNTVQSKHTLEDAKKIAKVITSSELLVRVNPIHEATEEYSSSEEEIHGAIQSGADWIMLPYFKTTEEVELFISYVNKQAKTILLLETPEAVECLDEILELEGIDEIFIGLNDLSLGYGKKFMFEVLSDGTVDKIIEKLKASHIPYGFGGLASLNEGLVPGKMILKEHYRLGSESVILSRSFCDASKVTDIETIKKRFNEGVCAIRAYEKECVNADDYLQNQKNVQIAVESVVKNR